MLARYSKENGVEFIWNSLKKVKDLTPEVQSQISKLTNMVITDCNGTASALKITDSSVIGFMDSMQKSGTSYTNAKDALSGYQSYLKSTGQAAQLTSLKTKALSASMKVLSTIGWMAFA